MASKNAIKKRKIHKECWNLDHAWLSWLAERLPVYLNDAIVDLEYHTFTYNDKTYTQKEIIERMIYLLDRNKHRDAWDGDEYFTDMAELLDLWKLVFHAMWW